MTAPLPPMPILRAFVAVARTGSFTRAAETLNVTQTAVSHQVRQLEDWVGARLFERTSRRVSVTRTATVLLSRVEAALQEIAAAVSDARAAGAPGRLTVATTPEFAAQWLLPRLARFREAHPDIDLRVVAEYRRARFPGDGVDVAILLGSGGPGERADRLFQDEEFAVCSPELHERLPERQALLAAPLLRYEGMRFTALDWRRWLGQYYGLDPEDGAARVHAGLDFEGGPEFPSFGAMLAACRRGDGFALVRSSLVADDLEAGTLVRAFVEALPADLHYHVVFPEAAGAEPNVARFRTWLMREAAG